MAHLYTLPAGLQDAYLAWPQAETGTAEAAALDILVTIAPGQSVIIADLASVFVCLPAAATVWYFSTTQPV